MRLQLLARDVSHLGRSAEVGGGGGGVRGGVVLSTRSLAKQCADIRRNPGS